MSKSRWMMLAVLLSLAANTGCCRLCHRWCGPYAAPAPVVQSPVYAAPAPQAGACCVPCVPCCPQSSPVTGAPIPQPVPQWKKQYYSPPETGCCN